MSIIPNYLALYNLSQIEADILIVSDLTATIGTIYTLNSTTGNISTANITIANITTLLTDLWKGTTASSSMVIGVSGDSGTLTSWRDLIMSSGKKITLNSTGGKVLSNIYTGTSTSSAMSLGEFGDTSNITFYKNINMGATRFITIQSDGTLYVNTITATDSSADATLFSNHTGNINLGYTFSLNPINLNCSTILATNKNLTLQGSGKITTPGILVSGTTASKLLLTDASKNIISSAYDETTLPVSTPTQTALNLKANIDNPTFTTAIGLTSGNLTISSGTILANTYTGLTTSSSISLFGTSTSTIDLGNSSSASVIRLNQNTSLTAGKIFRAPYLYPTSTVADLYVGNQATDSGILYIELNTDLHSSRKLKLNNTTASKLLLTNASKEIISSAYDETTLPVSTPTQTALNLKANIDNPTFTTAIGLTSGNITVSSGTLLSNTFTGLTTSSSISLFTTASVSSPTITLGSATGGTFTIRPDTSILGNTTLNSNLLCNTYRGTAVGSAISLFSTTTAGITVGGASSGISLADNTSLASGKNLSISASGKIVSNTIEAVSVSTTGSVFTNLTVGDLNVGTGLTTGDVFLHNSTYTAGGNIYCNRDTYIDPSRKLVCDNHSGTSDSIDLSLAGNLMTGNVNIGTGLTSGNVNLGVIGMTGKISCNANVEIGTSANNKGLSCNYLQGFNVGDVVRYAVTTTTGNIRLGESQSTGNITLGHSTPASDSGTLIINKTTTLAANKNLTLGSQSKLVGGSNGSVNITAGAYTNVAVITTASVAGFYQVFIYGSSATQTYSVCCFMSADNSGAVQTTASRNMTFQASGANWCITATVAPTSTISMGYNIVRLF